MIAARYFKYLDIFISVLEEEVKLVDYEERDLTNLVKWSQASRAMWLHILLLFSFNNYYSFPFTQLRQFFGDTEWAKCEKEFNDIEELKIFMLRKLSELNKYNKALE